jgi:hypothetical protein
MMMICRGRERWMSNNSFIAQKELKAGREFLVPAE